MKYTQYFCFVIFAFLFFPVSLFCNCAFSSPNHAYFNENTYSDFPIKGGGSCFKKVLLMPFDYPCNELKHLSGSLPADLIFVNQPGVAGLIIGTPAEGTQGDYTLNFTISSDNGHCSATQSATQTLIVTVLAEGVPHPPMDPIGEQISPSTLNPIRAKSHLSINDYKNIIEWKAPESGPTIAAFRIYRDKNLTKLVKEVPVHERREYKYTIRHRSPNKNYKYYLVSVSDEGKISPSVLVKIKGVDKEGKNKRKIGHVGCT